MAARSLAEYGPPVDVLSGSQGNYLDCWKLRSKSKSGELRRVVQTTYIGLIALKTFFVRRIKNEKTPSLFALAVLTTTSVLPVTSHAQIILKSCFLLMSCTSMPIAEHVA